MTRDATPDAASFRDPSGVVFRRGGTVYRQINTGYAEAYRHLMNSGLYGELTRNGLLIPHEEVTNEPPLSGCAFAVIRPEQIPFISYPYEWPFGFYKDAALTTLRVHRVALERGMALKDASAYNIQFYSGRAVLIDTLSFDFYRPGEPWGAYGQFCRHFLAPLLLMARVDVRLSGMMREYIDGIPLDLASRLLKGGAPSLAVWQHIHLHAASVSRHSSDGRSASPVKPPEISPFAHKAMIDSLIAWVERLTVPRMETEWGDYYEKTNYSDAAAQAKEHLVADFIGQCAPKTVWDFGANDGRYTRIARDAGAFTVAFDMDPVAVEKNHTRVKREKDAHMLPLLLDLTNPSPSIGFANKERGSIRERQRPDAIMMLAVIHHMAISNNLPLPLIAAWLYSLTRHLIIEFVPKEDSQVQVLLSTRQDIFPEYTREGFESAFSMHFELLRVEPVTGSRRTLYLLSGKA